MNWDKVDFSPFWISVKVAGVATGIVFFLGLGTAYAMLGYRGRWKSLLEGIFLAPLVLPPTVVGFLLLVLFGKNGWLGHWLAQWHISVVFTWYGGVIAATVVAFPLMYKTVLGAFTQVDHSLLAIAQTLGANPWRTFWQVLLPLSLPGVLAGTVLSFARALGEFGATLMLAGNIQGETQTMPMAIYFAVEAGAMEEAWLWTGAIMGLSFTAIALVNLWQRLPVVQVGGGSVSHTSIPQLKGRGLEVAIEKRMGSFCLGLVFQAESESLGILGGSGSGKSLTLKCIAGVETPTHGRIVLNGRTLFDSERGINVPSHRRKVSLVFQHYALFPHLTVAQNIGFGLQHLDKRERRRRIHHFLDAFQLSELGNRYPHQLSGGQQQRVALARALATEPEALLLDEPFAALDTYLRHHMEQQLIQTLRNYKGCTLFVSHNLEELYRVCGMLIVMSEGKSIACAHKSEIFDRPPSLMVAQLTGCKNFSRAKIIDTNIVEAIDWGVTLQLGEKMLKTIKNVGIRAHHLKLLTDYQSSMVNTFPCWLASISETPHRVTLFLRLNPEPQNMQDYHLQAEIFKERWETIKGYYSPFYVQLEPLRLILLES